MVREYRLNERHRNSSWERTHKLKRIMQLLAPILYPFSIMAILFFIVGALDRRLPSVVKENDIKGENGHLFSAEKAYNKLHALTEVIGPRVTGSPENEFETVVYILQEIDEATKQLNDEKKDRVLVDVQHSNGWYYLDDGQLSIYEGIQNIVVKLVSRSNSTSSLLINCHYDTFPTSPGASDDAIMCATMIELLRALSHPNAITLPHNVIFLFNGNEESQLQGSHAFITQHEWAKEVKAFINLDSAGAGGRELLFQSGPGNSWLLKAYAESVPYPSASSIVEEIFQYGLFPSDTDFRIFRDFGNIPGLDIAYTRNGYVYHTKYDDINKISMGSMQHTGENLLALIPQLISSSEFSTNNKSETILSPVLATDQPVYFDAVGLFIVNYSEEVALVTNVVILLFSIIILFVTIFMGLSTGSRETRLWKIIIGTGKALVGWITGAAFAFTTALILDAVNHPMPWFSQPVLIFPLFYVPTLLGCCLPYVVILPHRCIQKCQNCQGVKKSMNKEGSDQCINPEEDVSIIKLPTFLFQSTRERNCSWEDVYMDILGVQLIWAVIILICVILGIRSTYIFAPLVLFPVSSHVIILLWNRWRSTDKGWVIMNQIFCLPSTAFVFYYTIMAFAAFVPATARIGPGINPGIVIASIAVACCIMAFSHIVPIIQLHRLPKVIVFCFIGLYVLMILLVTLTPIGFPFGNNKENPTPQRIQVLHVRRRHYEFGEYYPVKQQNFFWMIDWDRNGAKYSLPDADLMGAKKVSPETCYEELFCGLPVYMSYTIGLLPHTHVSRAPEPQFSQEAELQLISRMSTKTTRKLTFSITGGCHLALGISPVIGVKLKGWNYGDLPYATYYWQEVRPVYYLYYAKGIASGQPWIVWIDLEISPDAEYQFIVDVALIAHYNFGNPVVTATEIVNQTLGPVPPWADLVSWPASYDGWKF